MPTISGGEADGGVGIESSSEGFWTYCLVCLEPPDGIDTLCANFNTAIKT